MIEDDDLRKLEKQANPIKTRAQSNPSPEGVGHKCAICGQVAHKTYTAVWDKQQVRVCASCYKYETGGKPCDCDCQDCEGDGCDPCAKCKLCTCCCCQCVTPSGKAEGGEEGTCSCPCPDCDEEGCADCEDCQLCTCCCCECEEGGTPEEP
jgi:hypothetical protein